MRFWWSNKNHLDNLFEINLFFNRKDAKAAEKNAKKSGSCVLAPFQLAGAFETRMILKARNTSHYVIEMDGVSFKNSIATIIRERGSGLTHLEQRGFVFLFAFFVSWKTIE